MNQNESSKFDAYAADYTALNARTLGASGEAPVYFAEYKLRCLQRLLGPDFNAPMLDYGCGIGELTEQLVKQYQRVDGFDPSRESLTLARRKAPGARFFNSPNELTENYYGVAVMAGVLHHVPPAERGGVIARVVSKLVPGHGRLVVFEHNPLNPLTRRASAACVWDDDAILLWPWQARRLLSAALDNVRLDFIVFFPRALALLRRFEPHLSWLPMGAQMMLVGLRRSK